MLFLCENANQMRYPKVLTRLSRLFHLSNNYAKPDFFKVIKVCMLYAIRNHTASSTWHIFTENKNKNSWIWLSYARMCHQVHTQNVKEGFLRSSLVPFPIKFF